MKKKPHVNILAFLLLILYCLPFNLFASEQIYLSVEDKKYLNNISSINIYVEPDIYFYSYSYGNFSSGYAIEYLKLISKKLNKKINIITDIPKNKVKKRLMNGNLNFAILPSFLKKKDESILCSKTAIGILTPSLLMSKIYQLPINLNRVEKLSVVLIKGDRYSKIFAKKYPDFELIWVNTIKEAIKKVKTQEVDIAVGFHEIFSSYIENKQIEELQSIPFDDNTVFPTFKFHLTSSYKNKHLMKILDKVVLNFTYEELYFLRDDFFPGNALKQTNIKVDLTEEEKQYLMKKQLLNVCTIPDNMPFSDVTKNQFLGMAASFVKLIEEALDIPIQIIPTMSRNESLKKFNNKECDFLSISSDMYNPTNTFSYTSSLFEVPLVIVTTDDYLYFDEFKKISDKEFLIKKNHSMLVSLKKQYPKIKLKEIESSLEGLKLLEEGKYFGFITSRYSVSSLFKSHIADTLKISSQIPLKMKFSFAVRKENIMLLNILEKTSQFYIKDKVLNIIDSFVTQKYPRGFDYSIILQLVFVFLIFSAIILRQHLKVSLQNSRLGVTQKKLALLNEELEQRVKNGIKKSREKDILLYRQSKYASMGEMIGNIAHQWRQPLMELSALQMELQASVYFKKKVTNEEVVYNVNNSNKIIDFMSHTIEDFRNFFSTKKEITFFNTIEVINESLNIMKNAFSHHKIKIEVISPSDKIMTYGYKNEYAQVLINILSNAKDIFLSREIQYPKVTIRISQDKNFSIVSIDDNAGGIKEEYLEKIFDPFFTKEKKSGTGIGLFMSKMIIESHMKGLLLANNTNNGARFLIKIPQKSFDSYNK